MRSSPCKDCPERFPACSAHCPKDERGEYGYKAWRVDFEAKRRALWNSYKRDNSHTKKKFK